ncbi:hypothetical protein PAL_GLEAN10020354 [Pteropus alecto]|uniref:Mitotic-spindle organizing protein 1 n=1 Tax=Pteropus alecto TaxID=9402 RepID=L5KH53_PTEAL|nr:hypothetical protein PAL_GLEAN10020354 [Pteropus alecto]
MKHTSWVLLEISRILNTGLDMETLSICVRLCEQGINPEALSSVIKELRKATEALKAKSIKLNENEKVLPIRMEELIVLSSFDKLSGNMSDLCSAEH